ncbi:MAG: hypothetical protein U0U67_00795 [Chitinophagales bacterium]
MHYISPFHFLPTDLLQDLPTASNKIKLARKRLLAEIELSPEQSIIINGKELTKFDIISLFDSLSTYEVLTVHSEIYKDKQLLQLLEDGIFTPNSNFNFNPRLTDNTAIQIISPYYKEAALNYLNNLIDKKEDAAFKQFFLDKHLLSNEDTFELHENLSKQFMAVSKKMEEAADKIESKIVDEKIIVDELNNVKIGTTIKFLNCLPDDFEKLREDIAVTINSLACSLINNKYQSIAVPLLKKAQLLHCSEYIQEYFSQNLAIAQNISSNSSTTTETSTSSGKSSVYTIVVAIIIVLRIVLILTRSSSSTSNYVPVPTYSYPTPEYYDTSGSIYAEEIVSDSSTTTENQSFSDYSYTASNNSFDNFMTLLYNQRLLFSPGERVYKSCKSGENVYKSLFALPVFAVSKKRTINGRHISTETKKVKFVNKTDYECILLIRNTIMSVPVEFTSKYIPAKGSLVVSLKDGYNDVRPYMGNKLIKNEFYSKATVTESNYDNFTPDYLFETVPRKNALLKGIRIDFDEVKDTNATVILQENADDLESDETGLTK